MSESTKKFDTYEDFVEHIAILLSHNTYESDVTTDKIAYFVREISKKLDSNTMNWKSNAGWNLALDDSTRNLAIGSAASGFAFSDPQGWGITGLTNKQILVLYSCVHSILLTGAKDLDEWRSIAKAEKPDTSGCLPLLVFVGFVILMFNLVPIISWLTR